MRAILSFAVFAIACNTALGQNDSLPETARARLRKLACFYGYPNAMLLHTAFHESKSTRFLLLKAALVSEHVRTALELTPEQVATIQNLNPVAWGKYRLDPTQPAGHDSPDEQAVDPDYFRFLSPRQMAKLDALAFRFDGYPALTRQSMISHVQLSDATNKAVAKFVQEIRSDIVLPRVRENFAAKLPKDHAYRECFLDGNIYAHANTGILEVLTDAECERLDAFLKEHNSPEAVRSIEAIAVFPYGMVALHTLVNGLR